MKIKNYRFIGLAIIAAFLIVLPSVASAELTVYFEQPQSIDITYNTSTNSAIGTNIAMMNFTVGSTSITGATLSFNFTGGAGSLTVSNGGVTLFAGTLSAAQIHAVGAPNYYQIIGSITPNTSMSSLYGFDFGEINFTFRPDKSYRAGYVLLEGEGSKTPIPAAFLLFGSGLFGLVCIRRRKK